LTDQALIAALVAGDPQAARIFVQRFGPIARHIAMHLFRCDEERGRELLQQLFLHLCENDWRRLRQWDGRGRLESYVYTIARRLMLREIERGRPEGPLPEEEDQWPVIEDPPDEPALPPADRKALEECLHEAMSHLSARDRQLVARRHWRGASYREIAEIEGMTVNGVGVALLRAERRLAGWMERICARLLTLFSGGGD